MTLKSVDRFRFALITTLTVGHTGLFSINIVVVTVNICVYGHNSCDAGLATGANRVNLFSFTLCPPSLYRHCIFNQWFSLCRKHDHRPFYPLLSIF